MKTESPQDTPGPPRKSCLHLCGIGILCLAAYFGIMVAFAWWRDPVRQLKHVAAEVHEFTTEGGWRGVSNCWITAQYSEEVFQRFAASQGLDPLPPRKPDQYLRWLPFSVPWWHPPTVWQEGRGYYSRREGDESRLLVYSNGHLYYQISTL